MYIYIYKLNIKRLKEVKRIVLLSKYLRRVLVDSRQENSHRNIQLILNIST